MTKKFLIFKGKSPVRLPNIQLVPGAALIDGKPGVPFKSVSRETSRIIYKHRNLLIKLDALKPSAYRSLAERGDEEPDCCYYTHQSTCELTRYDTFLKQDLKYFEAPLAGVKAENLRVWSSTGYLVQRLVKFSDKEPTFEQFKLVEELANRYLLLDLVYPHNWRLRRNGSIVIFDWAV